MEDKERAESGEIKEAAVAAGRGEDAAEVLAAAEREEDTAEAAAVTEREEDTAEVSAVTEQEEDTAEVSAAAGREEDAAEVSAVTEQARKPACPEAAIEAILFAVGNSVTIGRLAEILAMTEQEVRESVTLLKAQYEREDRGITITELEDAVQLGTKGEYYSYLMKLAKHPKQYSLSDTVIETLSIIAYKQPVTRAQIEQIRGVSCDHALNKLLEYELVEEVGRLDAPGKPLLFGTTEQFLRSFGVRSIGELPSLSPELIEDFKLQAEAEAEENLKVDV